MSSPFSGLNIASSALRAFQRQLDVTGHNIANQNTEGYSRQTVDLKTADPTTEYSGRMITLGQGVDIRSVNRIRDSFLDQRRQGVASEQGSLQARYSTLNAVQGTLLEPGDSGVSAALGKFFDAWSGLASNPGASGAKVTLQSAGRLLADRVRGLHQDLGSQLTLANSGIKQSIQEMQSKVNAIAELNKSIRAQTVAGGEANDLSDQRDSAIQALSGLADIQAHRLDDGSVTITLNQLTLVDPIGAHTVPTGFDATTGKLVDDKGTYDINGGSLGGQLSAAGRILDYQSKLDDFANTLKSSVNSIFSNAKNAAGETGLKFFADSIPANGADGMYLDAKIEKDAAAIGTGPSGKSGDGTTALALSQLLTL